MNNLYLIIVETRAVIEAPNWQVDGSILWADNCDFGGPVPDLFQTDNVNRDDCRKLCFDNPRCSHFTWEKIKNRCHLKNGNWAGNKPNALSNAQCGFISGRSWTANGWTVDSTNLYWKNDCHFPGQDLSSTYNVNRGDCRKLCFDNPRCSHFTWEKIKNGCHLKNGNWAGNKPNALADAQCGFISGRSWTTDGWTVDTNLYWKNDCEFWGRDMFDGNNPVRNIINRGDCGKLCLDNPLCSLFTWYSGGNACYLKTGMNGDTPSRVATASCGYIPSRSWKEAAAPSDVVWGSNCGFAGIAWPYNSQTMYNRETTSKEECARQCGDFNSWPFVCTHFTFENGNCYSRNWKVEYLKGAFYLPNAQCGYLKSRKVN